MTEKSSFFSCRQVELCPQNVSNTDSHQPTVTTGSSPLHSLSHPRSINTLSEFKFVVMRFDNRDDVRLSTLPRIILSTV